MTAAPSRMALRRIACAVVAAEVRRQRGRDLPMPHDWADTMPIGDDGLGLDSLEQLGAIGALAEVFGLDDASLGNEPPQLVGAWIDWITQRHATGDGQVVVSTSGSTGTPVSCTHAMADLVMEAHDLAGRCPGRRRVMALVPAHHLYGIIWTAILPDILDVPVVVRHAGAALDLAPGDLVVAVPDQWQTISRRTHRFPDDIIGVSSAAPLADAQASDLLAAGLARLIDIYGSSETGGIAVRELPATTYQLLHRWHLSGAEDEWHVVDRKGKSHALPDHIERIGDRDIRPVGRRDGALQVGGHNVWPSRVADVLRQIDGVAEVAVRLNGNGRLKAFIVPDAGQDETALLNAIELVAADRLYVAERPRDWRFGPALPRNAMGKLEDWA